jgi:hypothetical protein
MIAFDAIEEMGAKTFNLINPDAREHRGPGAIEIARNSSGIERPHSKLGMILVDDQRLPGASDAERGAQAMCLALERGEALGSLAEIARLVEDPAFERERLIGAETIGLRSQSTDGERFGAGQLDRQTFQRPAASEKPTFESPLVDIGADNFSVDSHR